MSWFRGTVAVGGGSSIENAKGAFLLKAVKGLNHRIRVFGLSNKYYVKEFRVDGRVAVDGIVALSQGSQLDVVLDDRPAAIIGTVTDGGKPFSQPLVFVAKWPTFEVVASRITGEDDSSFKVTGLAPGEYRVLAVQSALLPDGQQIFDTMLDKLWSSSEKVTLERGGSQIVSLKLSDTMR